MSENPTTPTLIPVVWDLGQTLHPDLRGGLAAFYNRTPFIRQGWSPQLIGSDIDTLLQEAANRKQADWAVVMAMGNIYEQQNQIVREIETMLENINEDVLVCGHLMNRKGFYCGLHEQFFLVNLRTYERLDSPKFGQPEQGALTLHNYEAGPSVHDDYTPQWLRGTGTTSTHQTDIGGWNFVNASLMAGLPVFNIANELRQLKVFIYPDDDTEKLNKNIDLLYQLEDLANQSQRAALAHLFLKRLNMVPDSQQGLGFNEAGNCLFVFNSESLLPEENWNPNFEQPLDIYAGPCSGFQDVAFAKMCGIHEASEVLYYDYNDNSLRLKKFILDNFSGDIADLPKLIDSVHQEFPYDEIYTGHVESKVKEILKCFQDNPKDFYKFWQQFKKLKKTFIKANLLTDPTTITTHFGHTQRIVFNVTDIYLAQNEIVRGLPKMKQLFTDLEDHCKKWPNLYLTGQNLNQEKFFTHSKT